MSQRAVNAARQWLGTPFLAGASVRDVGCDCAGLVQGIARELGIMCPSHSEMGHDILAAATTLMLPANNITIGTVVLLSRDPGGPPVHAALVTDTGTLIHAHWSAGVVENRFGNWFARRVTHNFAWPMLGTLEHFPPF